MEKWFAGGLLGIFAGLVIGGIITGIIFDVWSAPEEEQDFQQFLERFEAEEIQVQIIDFCKSKGYEYGDVILETETIACLKLTEVCSDLSGEYKCIQGTDFEFYSYVEGLN